MIKVRLIPILLLQNGRLVRAETFSRYQVLGNPFYEAKRYNEWSVDELIYLNITRSGSYVQRSVDQVLTGMESPEATLEQVSRTCFMPLTWGGGLRSLEDIARCFELGADKITLNTAASAEPELVTQAARVFGSQAVVVSIDYRRRPDGVCGVYVRCGQEATGRSVVEWGKEVEDRGAGEILLTSIDNDGLACGYDLGLINQLAAVTSIPIIACGGVGNYGHFVSGVEAGASAVAAANIFHFKEMADRRAKRVMSKAGVNVRL